MVAIHLTQESLELSQPISSSDGCKSSTSKLTKALGMEYGSATKCCQNGPRVPSILSSIDQDSTQFNTPSRTRTILLAPASSFSKIMTATSSSFATIFMTKTGPSGISNAEFQHPDRPKPVQDSLPDLPDIPLSFLGFVGLLGLMAILALVLLVCAYKITFPQSRFTWGFVLQKLRLRRPKHSKSPWLYHPEQTSPNASSHAVLSMSSAHNTPTHSPGAFSSAFASPMTASFPPNPPWLTSGISHRGASRSDPISPHPLLNREFDEELLVLPPSPRNPSMGLLGSDRGTKRGRQALWGIGEVVGAVTRRIVEWSVDDGGEDELLLPVTETERGARVEY